MKELNMATYIQALQAGFTENRTQEAAAKLILNSISGQDYVVEKYGQADLGSKKISTLCNQKSSVPEPIIKGSLETIVVAKAQEYFEDVVVPELNPYLEEDILANVAALVNDDPTVSAAKKQSLMDLYESSDEVGFLCNVFLYVVHRPNVKPGTTVEYEDAPLLAEVNYECPMNHERLVEYVKDKPVKRYSVVQIFPDDIDKETAAEFCAICPKPKNLNDPDNLIVLCDKCAEIYETNPTVDEYKNLHEIKKRISRSYKARLAADRLSLDDDIRAVLEAIMQLSNENRLIELSYDALHIEEKISSDYFVMRNETKNHVIQYYKYIEGAFAESDADFDSIATEIHLCSMRFEKSGMSQEEVVLNLANWIRDKAGLPEGKITACNIVVSFFIQNCEVFHK